MPGSAGVAPGLAGACVCMSPTQDKLYQPEYQEVSTEEQREEISGKLSAASTWLEDEGVGATTVVRGLSGHGRWNGSSPSSPRVREREKSRGLSP